MIREHYDAIEARHPSFWWFVARRDLFTSLLNRYRRPERHLAVDLGCGPGSNAALYPVLAEKVLSLDLEPSVLRTWPEAASNPRLVASALAIPVRTATADLVTMMDVLEHLPDEVPALREIRRIMIPGGLVLFSVPAFQSLWAWHDEQAHHYRRYRLSQLRRLLESEGFRVLEAHYFNCFLSAPIWLVRKVLRTMGLRKNKVEMELSLGVFNMLFLLILRFENRLRTMGVHMPFGTSAVVLVSRG